MGTHSNALTKTQCAGQTNQPGPAETAPWFCPSSYLLILKNCKM